MPFNGSRVVISYRRHCYTVAFRTAIWLVYAPSPIVSDEQSGRTDKFCATRVRIFDFGIDYAGTDQDTRSVQSNIHRAPFSVHM